jgi:membrane-associated phospholipid phosphatase
MTEIDTVCAVIRSPGLHWLMVAMGALGDVRVALAVAGLVLVWGIATRSEHRRGAGGAALIAILTASVVSNLLKVGFQIDRPLPGYPSYGFPSGHSSTVFALAAALGYAWPPAAPWLGLSAVVAGVARVYFRAHHLGDVLGGCVVGLGTGVIAARVVLGRRHAFSRRAWAGWTAVTAATLGALVLFARYEDHLTAHRVLPADGPAAFTIAFGTPAGRPHLGPGWWIADELWADTTPMVWALGHEAGVRLPGLPAEPHRLRLRVLPFGLTNYAPCQRMTVALNDTPLARVLLERGWRDYEIPVPAGAVRPEGNDLHFRFAHAERPADVGLSQKDQRLLAVAFTRLTVLPGGSAR